MISYPYARPICAADCVVFGWSGDLRVLLMKRTTAPFENAWALPGRFIREGQESPIEAAATALKEKVGVTIADMFVVGVYGDPKRDPRGHTISIAFGSLVVSNENLPTPGGNASQAEWFALDSLPDLAFDHRQIIESARVVLAERLRSTPDAMTVMPERFSVPDFKALMSAVTGTTIDVRNFAANFNRLVKVGVFKAAGRETNVAHRPARLFKYDADACKRFVDAGGRFSIVTPTVLRK